MITFGCLTRALPKEVEVNGAKKTKNTHMFDLESRATPSKQAGVGQPVLRMMQGCLLRAAPMLVVLRSHCLSRLGCLGACGNACCCHPEVCCGWQCCGARHTARAGRIAVGLLCAPVTGEGGRGRSRPCLSASFVQCEWPGGFGWGIGCGQLLLGIL